MLRGSFNEGASQDETRLIEAVLIDYSGPHSRAEWPFYFCALRLDDGRQLRATVRDWPDGLKAGERVRGSMLVLNEATDLTHIDVLERANPLAPASLLHRLRGMVERKFGR